MDRHPEARVLALSPALTILRKGEELMPLLNTTGVTDFAPLMNLPNFSPTHFNKRAIASTIK